MNQNRMCRQFLGLFAAAMLLAPLGASARTPVVGDAARPSGLSIAELRTRHALPESRFIEIAGVPVHYTDQGKGPVVVLLHGSYLDLTSWDDWVADLARDHRVIRMDRIRFGLTGHFPDRAPDYAAEQLVLDGLVDALKLDRFALAGSSSGGIVAAQYADRHPDKVSRLILMNFPLGHGRISMAGPTRNEAQTPAERMDMLLRYNLVDHRVITPKLLARLTDFADRQDPTGAIAGQFKAASALAEGDRAAMLGRLRMPTLVMWAERNRTLPVAEGRAAFDAIGAKDKRFVVVKRAGHMMPLEAGARSVRTARRFLASAAR